MSSHQHQIICGHKNNSGCQCHLSHGLYSAVLAVFFLFCLGSLYVLLPDRAEETDSWNIPYISVSRSVSVSCSVHLCRKRKKGSSWWTSTTTTWPASRPPSCRMLQVNDGSQHPEQTSVFPGSGYFSPPSPLLLCSQTTLTTSRNWLGQKSSVLVEITTASQGEHGGRCKMPVS